MNDDPRPRSPVGGAETSPRRISPSRRRDWPAPGVERLPLFPSTGCGGLHLRRCLPAGILAGADPVTVAIFIPAPASSEP